MSILVSGCGGGGGLAAPIAPTPSAAPAGGPAQVTIRITVPAATHRGAASRGPRYISLDTESAAIAVNGGAPVVVDLSSTSPNCTPGSAGSRVCTSSVNAPIGPDTFSETLYESTNATGPALSTGSTSATIVAGTANVVPLVLDGIIASLSLVLANAKPVEGTPTQIGLTVNFNDASGAAIIGAAPFLTPITLTDSDATGATTLSKTKLTTPADAASLTIAYTGALIPPANIGASAGSVVAPAVTLTPQTAGPTPAPTSSPNAFSCPTSPGSSATVVGRASMPDRSVARMHVRRVPRATATTTQTALVAVTYDAATANSRRAALGAREAALGRVVQTFDFRHTGVTLHVLAVPLGRVASVEAALRAQPGARSVGLTGQRRYATSVKAAYYPADPYFTGFATTVAPAPGATPPPPTFETTLAESAVVPGQWDMHAIGLEHAFAYAQANNGSGITNPAALGSSAVRLAIIDTGEDTTHPELAAKIAYQKCFLTNLDGVQSTSNVTTDPQGHGTDVAGIAGAATGNGLGFSGAGGNVSLAGYRVFPTPDDNCVNDNATDPQCGSDTADIAAAIEDAIAHDVNVISMSLGGSGCTTSGVDPDPIEGAAVADAVAANVIVVAAAGNSAGPPVESPACDAGVIAVGATGLADGSPNGTNDNGSATTPREYVAAYSDYGTPGAAVNSSSAWGIVAPGGDPSSDDDLDNLHWIENIWTSTPYMSGPGDQSFAGTCADDYATSAGPVDCRVLIAGTSMATPHVAGAAALILAVNPGYGSPAKMKQLLCATADDISDPAQGCGRLDVYRAMARALGDSAPPAPRPIP